MKPKHGREMYSCAGDIDDLSRRFVVLYAEKNLNVASSVFVLDAKDFAREISEARREGWEACRMQHYRHKTEGEARTTFEAWEASVK